MIDLGRSSGGGVRLERLDDAIDICLSKTLVRGDVMNGSSWFVRNSLELNIIKLDPLA